MTRLIAALWPMVIATVVGTLAWSGAQARTASAKAHRARAQLAILSEQVQELASLRVPPQVHPGAGLASRVTAALGSCGLPASALSSLSPDSVADKGGRQRAVVVLAGPTLPQTGMFLKAWRRAEPGWVIAAVELAPSAGAAPGADLPLRATIRLEAWSAEAPSSSAPEGGAS